METNVFKIECFQFTSWIVGETCPHCCIHIDNNRGVYGHALARDYENPTL